MARIVVISHAYDQFGTSNYLLRLLGGLWKDAGHKVSLVAGLDDWPDADVAILHVDLSVTPAAYAQASKRYPVVVNGAALDIRKNVVSRILLRPDEDWDGPVVVKTDLNCRGMPELRVLKRAKAAGGKVDLRLPEHSCMQDTYPILRSIKDVPDAVWQSPGLVVERFLPEPDPRGYWMRAWVFFGDRERSGKYLGTHPIVKGSNIVAREPAPVPDEMRRERQRLGFDYGKFDFVMHDGKAILLDANRTPWAPTPQLNSELAATNANLASGLAAFLRKE